MKKIVVIGSGIAGLAAANHLNPKNFNITVLDKGKYPGGRISTRKNKEFIFNHGAQFFTAKSNEFKKICQSGVKDNILINWNTFSKKNRYIGNPNMREFSFWFSKNLKIYQQTLVKNIEYNDSFSIITNNKKFKADGLIITAPSSQAAELIKNLDNQMYNLIEKVTYFPCWCLMLSIKDMNLKHFDIDEKSIFSWIISENNKIKNSLNYNCITIHTNEKFSLDYLEQNKEFVLDKIIREFTKIYQVNTQDIIYKNIHRWRYAKVKNPFPIEESKISKKIPLGIAGDWCPPAEDTHYNGNGQRIEDAFLSGIECSKVLIKQYFK
tara:strand:+ start:889 stop:1857 length:969 start_codon:yes stop_codon:yes gene_type:complete